MAANIQYFPTVLNAADSGTGWLDIGGGSTPALNTDLYLNGTGCYAKRIDNQLNRGFWYDNTSNIDLSNASARLLMWIYCTTPRKLWSKDDGGFRIVVGTTTSNYSEWEVAGSDTWPAAGGWQLVEINIGTSTPTNDFGTGLTKSQCRFFGVIAIMGNIIQGNSQNIACDTISYSGGGGILTMNGGTGGVPLVLKDFLDADGSGDPSATNKYGTLVGAGSNFAELRHELIIGPDTVDVFWTDSNKTIQFVTPEFSVAPKLTFDLKSTSVVSLTHYIFIGAEEVTSFALSGSGSVTFTECSFIGFNTIDLTLASQVFTDCVFDNLNAGVVVRGGVCNGSTFRNGAFARVGFIIFTGPDPDGKLDDTNYFSKGTGHGIHVDVLTGTAVTLNNQFYTGYGADGTTDAVIWNDNAKHVTYTVVGGDIPTILDGAGATHTILKDITLTIDVVDQDGNPQNNIFEITVTEGNSPPVELPGGHVELAPASSLALVYDYAKDGDTVTVLVMAVGYVPLALDIVLGSVDQVQILQVQDDRNYLNPV